jgi:hypothetical protein
MIWSGQAGAQGVRVRGFNEFSHEREIKSIHCVARKVVVRISEEGGVPTISAGNPASQNEAGSLRRVSGKIRPSKGRKSDSAGKPLFRRNPLRTARPKWSERQFPIMPIAESLDFQRV